MFEAGRRRCTIFVPTESKKEERDLSLSSWKSLGLGDLLLEVTLQQALQGAAVAGLVLGHFINHFAALVIVGGTNCGMKRLAVQAFGVRILMIFRLSMYKAGTSSFMFTTSMLHFCTAQEVQKWQKQRM